jgi:DNA-binding NarL/FixJ family response regulator
MAGNGNGRSAAVGDAPVIWVVWSGRDPALLRRITLALVVDGLRVSLSLSAAQALQERLNLGFRPPDVLIFACDLARDDCSLLRALSRALPGIHSVVVSPMADGARTRRALEAGANGVVDELRLDQTLAVAVRAVAAGLVTLPPDLRRSAAKPVFTHREKQTLALVVEGLTNGEIAARLDLSESTVKSHLASAFAKLSVHSRSEAAAVILDPESGLAETALPPPRATERWAPTPPSAPGLRS